MWKLLTAAAMVAGANYSVAGEKHYIGELRPKQILWPNNITAACAASMPTKVMVGTKSMSLNELLTVYQKAQAECATTECDPSKCAPKAARFLFGIEMDWPDNSTTLTRCESNTERAGSLVFQWALPGVEWNDNTFRWFEPCRLADPDIPLVLHPAPVDSDVCNEPLGDTITLNQYGLTDLTLDPIAQGIVSFDPRQCAMNNTAWHISAQAYLFPEPTTTTRTTGNVSSVESSVESSIEETTTTTSLTIISDDASHDTAECCAVCQNLA